MYKRTITYENFEGQEIKEDFYFNLSKAEMMEMELKEAGGMSRKLQTIVDSKDSPAIIAMFKELIMLSYGEKSPDGRRFIKSPELSKEFSETNAYSDFYMLLAMDAEVATEFINSIIPQMPDNKSRIPAPA